MGMERKPPERHKLSVADVITIFRIAGTLVLAFLRPLSPVFYCVYAMTGITDVLDGWIARKTHTASKFGAKLDSIADLLFYAVMLIRILPTLWSILPTSIWYAVAFILLVRIAAYVTAAVKHRQFASLHTYLNKLTGLAVFCIPFLLITKFAVGYCWAVAVIGAASSLEELIIHLRKKVEQNLK